jgi:O-antigen/teichoic acid export membrane protein
MFAVDLSWSAITQIDLLLIGALLTSVAVGSFGAVLRLLTVLGYLATAVASGVAPRLSLGAGDPDTAAFHQGIRYMIIIQGLFIAPMTIWAKPIAGLLLGHGYRDAAAIMRVLALYTFISAPGALIALTVTYLGEARRRVPIMLATLTVGLAITYVLVRTVGLVGAAIADDLIQIVYVGAHLWICSKLITVDVRRLASSGVKTLIAAGAMALGLVAFGTGHLGGWQWVAGGCLGMGLFCAALLATGEVSVSELRVVGHRALATVRQAQ